MSCDDVDQPGWDMLTGAGRLNAAQAFDAPAESLLVSEVHEAAIQRRDGRHAVVVSGAAYGASFSNRTLQIAFGERTAASDWKTVSSSKVAVENGELGVIPGDQFNRRGVWQVRCAVQDSDGHSRESTLKITLR
jgi:hypothetical protein